MTRFKRQIEQHMARGNELMASIGGHMARNNELTARVDGHMARTNEHMARGNKLMVRIDGHMERGNELMEELREEMRINREAIESRDSAFEHAMGVVVRTLDDMRDDIRAQTRAIFTVIDRLEGGANAA